MEEKGTMIIEEFTKRSIISNAAFPSSAHSGYRYLNRSINPVKKTQSILFDSHKFIQLPKVEIFFDDGGRGG